VVSLCKKWNLTLRLRVRHNGLMLDLSLSRQEGTFSSRYSWWTCADSRLRCHCILDDNFLPARVSLDGWEGKAAFRPLLTMSRTQFSKRLIKPRSRRCKNSQRPHAFQLQKFGDAWEGIWDLLSSICIGFPTAWQRRNGKFELIDQSNYSDA
jgi:hypothetical protein